jgi:ethanolamine utilization protein EutS
MDDAEVNVSRIENEPKQRVIQEYVPGKQVTLAHVIASPHRSISMKLGLDEAAGDAIGILTITPSEGVIIAADIATKAAAVDIGFLDRFGGSLVLTGDVASVEASLRAVLVYFDEVLRYACIEMTRS